MISVISSCKLTPRKIRLRQQGNQFYYNTNYYSLLEALENYQVQVDFQCRAGYCGTCRLQLLQGVVKYLYEPLAFIHVGEILPCCCQPVSDIELC